MALQVYPISLMITMGEPVRLVRTEIRRNEPHFLMESTGKMSELSVKLGKIQESR